MGTVNKQTTRGIGLMEFFKYILGGVCLGITESFPVSGSGHLLLMGHIFGQDENFRIVFYSLHMGIIAAVIAIYHKVIFRLIKSFFRIMKNVITRKFNFKNLDRSENMLLALAIGSVPLLLLFMPVFGSGTNVLGTAREFSNTDNVILCGVSFLINGILLKLGIDSLKSDKFKYKYKTSDNVIKCWDGRMRFTVMDAVWCGVMQFISMIFPGISHVGAIFSIGLMRGINRQVMLDYSFLSNFSSIAVMLFSEIEFVPNFTEVLGSNIHFLLIGSLFSLVFGFLFIKMFSKMVKKNKAHVFSVYTMVLGIAMIVIGILEQMRGINIFSGMVL